MDNWAYRRYKSIKNDDDQPAEMIVEYANTTLFPEGYHKEKDGWVIVPEDEFLDELANNQIHLANYREEKAQRTLRHNETVKNSAATKQAKERQEEREFQQFLRWRKTRDGN